MAGRSQGGEDTCSHLSWPCTYKSAIWRQVFKGPDGGHVLQVTYVILASFFVNQYSSEVVFYVSYNPFIVDGLLYILPKTKLTPHASDLQMGRFSEIYFAIWIDDQKDWGQV